MKLRIVLSLAFLLAVSCGDNVHPGIGTSPSKDITDEEPLNVETPVADAGFDAETI